MCTVDVVKYHVERDIIYLVHNIISYYFQYQSNNNETCPSICSYFEFITHSFYLKQIVTKLYIFSSYIVFVQSTDPLLLISGRLYGGDI